MINDKDNNSLEANRPEAFDLDNMLIGDSSNDDQLTNDYSDRKVKNIDIIIEKEPDSGSDLARCRSIFSKEFAISDKKPYDEGLDFLLQKDSKNIDALRLIDASL